MVSRQSSNHLRVSRRTQSPLRRVLKWRRRLQHRTSCQCSTSTLKHLRRNKTNRLAKAFLFRDEKKTAGKEKKQCHAKLANLGASYFSESCAAEMAERRFGRDDDGATQAPFAQAPGMPEKRIWGVRGCNHQLTRSSSQRTSRATVEEYSPLPSRLTTREIGRVGETAVRNGRHDRDAYLRLLRQ